MFSSLKCFINTYSGYFLIVFCYLLSFLFLELYVFNFRQHPIYANAENIICSKSSIVVKNQLGGKFSSRDRKIFVLENGEVLKASLSIKLPAVDSVDKNSGYYLAALSGDLENYYLCYLLMEDQVLNDNHQVVYLSKYSGQNGLGQNYVSSLNLQLDIFNSEVEENGWWVYMKIYVLLGGVLIGVLGKIFENYISFGKNDKKEIN